MFRFAQSREAYWPVDLPSRSVTGEVVTHRVLIRYRLMSRSELLEANKRLQAATARKLAEYARKGETADLSAILDEMDRESRAEYEDVLARVTGWRDGDIADETGEPLAYSREVVAAMCEDQAIYQALVAGMYAASRGAPPKNS